MKTDTLTEKIVLENYQLAPATVRIKGQDEYLFTVHHSTDYKRTKKDAAEIGEIIVTRFNNYDSLLNIAKRCEFIFGNEANYPEGTIGYMLCQDAKKAIGNE